MDFQNLKTDKALEEQGVWKKIGEGAELLIARLGNKRYKKEYAKRTKPYLRQIRLGTMPTEIEDEILIDVIADTVLLDWRGFEDDGEAVPYSREAAVKYLTEVRDFRDLVVSLADDMEAYRQTHIEESAGN